MVRGGKRAEKFKGAADKLAVGEALDERYRNHKLSGNFKGHWECHLEPDWLLIYKFDGEWIVFERTGTHSDLFD